MKQQINLSPSDDKTVLITESMVKDGVYLKRPNDSEPGFVIQDCDRLKVVYSHGKYDVETFFYLRDLLITFIGNDCVPYHIPTGLRIVTEKVLTVADLKDGDAIGFIDLISKFKFYVANVGEGKLAGINANGSNTWNGQNDTIQACLPTKDVELFLFTEGFSELHKWLGEDEG